MSFAMLPHELLDAVCDDLPQPDLARLSYTASWLHLPAQRQLYRHVHISSSRHALPVVLTMARKPHIAHFVRSFAIDLDSDATLLGAFYIHLARAVSYMSELTSLRLLVDPSASWILKSLSFPRLIHFACPFALDSHVSAFLGRTPTLLELQVDSIPFRHERPAFALTPSSVPNLQEFVGSSQAAEAIVPSRPVHTVQLTSGDLTVDVATCLAQSSTDIAVLSGPTSSDPTALLQTLSKRIQRLLHLRLMTIYYSFSEAPDVNFYQDIAGALNAFTDLQTFELSGMHWGSQERKGRVDSNPQRVWQSQPLELEASDEELVEIDTYSDLFFGY
ncbi:hypothetical protein D9757_000216 [Collybiopsis confluens]|uniref:F-box domain-containing protein n=1 Tax=Collybiopsis confluens TaxID=2823264 RepID=A0A8H5I2E3_9AGAR|nr:hypothetical protein D9757_000216 [Collybiopsis confluens]